METEPQKNNFKERVLAAIEREDVRSYPKARFAMRLIILVIVGVLFLAVSIFIFSYVFFFVRVSGRATLLGSGSPGFWFFVGTFPWLWFLVDIALLITLEWMIRKFRFGYRRPVLYLLLVLLAASVSLGFIADRGGLNDDLLRAADAHRLPTALGEMFEIARRPPSGQGFCRCDIVTVGTSSFTAYDVIMRTPTATIEIILPHAFATSSLMPGEVVFVAGQRIATATIQAFDVSIMPQDPDDTANGGMNAY